MEHSSERHLYTATKRLVDALDHLENKLQSITVDRDRNLQQGQQFATLERENVALRQEKEQLSASLADLRYRYDDLHTTATTIHNKLDDSITRLTQILEDEQA